MALAQRLVSRVIWRLAPQTNCGEGAFDRVAGSQMDRVPVLVELRQDASVVDEPGDGFVVFGVMVDLEHLDREPRLG